MARSIKNLVASILISISCYLAWTSIWPVYSVTLYLKDQIEERNALLMSRAEIFKKIEDLKNESNSKYAELKRLALVLPEKNSYPELITAVDSIYSQSGIILPELQFGIVRENQENQIKKISFENHPQGTYQQFYTLLNHLEKNIRIFDVYSINIGLSVGIGQSFPKEISATNPLLDISINGQFYL